MKITEEVDVQADVFYPITCGDAKATLIWKKFVCPGINVKCVQVRAAILSTAVRARVRVPCIHRNISPPISRSVQRAAHQPKGVCVLSWEVHAQRLEESHPPQQHHAQVRLIGGRGPVKMLRR